MPASVSLSVGWSQALTVSKSPACELFRSPVPVLLSFQVGGGRD